MSIHDYHKKPVSPDKPSKIDTTGIKNPKLNKQDYEFPGAEIGESDPGTATRGEKKSFVMNPDSYAKEKTAEWRKAMKGVK